MSNSTANAFRLSEAILTNPKSLSDNNTKVSLVEKSIIEIDNLNSQKMAKIETIYLSNNNIQQLSQILQFPKTKNLSLSCNDIEKIEEIKYLKDL